MPDQPYPFSFVELEDLRADLDIATSDLTHDERLRGLIGGVCAACETYCNRPFMARDITAHKLDGDDSTDLLLKYSPVISVASITVDTVLIAATAYVLYNETGLIALTDGSVFASGRRNVTTVLRVGFEKYNFPQDVALAARLWCAHLFKIVKEQRSGIDSKSDPGGESITYSPRSMPVEVRELLDAWRLCL